MLYKQKNNQTPIAEIKIITTFATANRLRSSIE